MEGGYQTVEDNLDVEKNKTSYLSNSLVQTAMGLSMLIVGAVHYDDCYFNATTYLVVAGSVMVVLNLLTILAILTPCECDDKLLKVMTPLFSIAQFCIFIWGTIEVFGHYSSWEYSEIFIDSKTERYCNYTAYMFAFVLLLIQWVVVPILIVLCCCCACLTSCCCN